MPVLERASALVQSDPHTLLGAMAVTAIPALVGDVLRTAIALVDELFTSSVLAGALATTGMVVHVVEAAATLFLLLGLIRLLLNAVYGQPTRGQMVIEEGASFPLAVVTACVAVALTSMGLIFWVIPGLFVGLHLQYALFLQLDGKLGPAEALKGSWQLVTPYRGKLAAITGLTALALFFASAFTFGLAGYIAPAVFVLVQAVTYQSLRFGEAEPAP
jgi:uncharacterized membrane protein